MAIRDGRRFIPINTHMLSFLQFLLQEAATTPFTKRLEWVVKTERDPIVAYLTLVMLVNPEQFALRYLADDPTVLRRVRQEFDMSSGVSDPEVLAYLKDILLHWTDRGVWGWDDMAPIPTRSPWEKMIGWVAQCVRQARQQKLSITELNILRYLIYDTLTDSEMAVWGKAVGPTLMTLRPSQAKAHYEDWRDQRDAAKEKAIGTGHLQSLVKLPGGIELFDLTDPHDVAEEGAAMHNCLDADYMDNLTVHQLISVRQNGKRLYTAMIKADDSLVQFKGKFNKIPTVAEKPVVQPVLHWMKANGIMVDDCDDLGLILGRR